MRNKRYMAATMAACIFSLCGWAQMEFSFGETDIKVSPMDDGCTLVQLPEGTDLRRIGESMSVKVDGVSVPLDDINPTTAITRGEIETFVYKDKAYSFRFTDNQYSAYLFAYFNGNAQWQEQICFAISEDGFSYTPLNGGDPIINSADIANKKAVRDPHILRGEDGYFYMVVTDMR